MARGAGTRGRKVPTLVLLHGYGSNEKDLISLVPAVRMFLPGINARVIAVRASHQAPGRPRGFSWFPGSVMMQPSTAAIGATADAVADVIRRYYRQGHRARVLAGHVHGDHRAAPAS